ncbi:hypothetical protein HYG86_00210 [Alkalicella caledoniensis]|uniref:Uncharacterized protein n=1 Tax=Alkalicella caledoniensis TaxID=2731377 RepID=A0A7G9W3P9_ALKCA|nr:hypothetical protein [Alkalicella caledoniensis]QNO13311.1 hypothetical protein HYG86_00210 [Alkalicella caledoniensis]
MAKLTGLGLFVLEITALISAGKTVTIEEIEKHIDNEDVIEFITERFKESLNVDFINGIYDVEGLNKYFGNYSGYINGNESRKYGIVKKNDGLLLLISLVSDKVETECRSWEI